MLRRRASAALAGVLAVALPACGAPPREPSRPTAPPSAAPPPAPTVVPAAAPEAPAAIPSVTPTAPPAPDPGADAFPPKRVPPLHARTARAGDGEWAPFFEGAPGSPPVGVRTTVHPDPIKPQVYVTVVALDLRRVAIHLVSGTIEPASTGVPPSHRVGRVPSEDQPELLAVFNGGFMERHGHWGMRLGPDVYVPPRDEGCTVALYPDGAVRIRPWPDLAATEATATAWRQTPPCLVDAGTPHPTLLAEPKTRAWGGAVGGAQDIRRSAIGVDPTGRVLFYGSGEWTFARDLAAAMKAAGAANVAELDINWSYTKFLTFGRPAPGAPLEVTGTLVPKTKHTRYGYVEKPAERDFFYVTRRR